MIPQTDRKHKNYVIETEKFIHFAKVDKEGFFRQKVAFMTFFIEKTDDGKIFKKIFIIDLLKIEEKRSKSKKIKAPEIQINFFENTY